MPAVRGRRICARMARQRDRMSRRAVLALLLTSMFAPLCAAEAPDPAPFAASLAASRYWPVVTTHTYWSEVSMEATSRPLRRFNAPRPAARADNPTRRHVGIDLFANAGDAVIAVEDGRVVAFYPFLRAATGEMSYALIVAHEGYVANYGEVRATSLSARGLALGDAVRGGQEIAEISDTSQLHFETYVAGTRRNQSWRHGAARPPRVLDPTRLLLDLVQTGQRLSPAASD